MGRGIETAVMNFLKEEYFGRRGMGKLNALFMPTNKNMPAQQFYPDQGFETVTDGSSGDTSKGCHYTLLADNSSIVSCYWIKIK